LVEKSGHLFFYFFEIVWPAGGNELPRAAGIRKIPQKSGHFDAHGEPASAWKYFCLQVTGAPSRQGVLRQIFTFEALAF
jgi:hypothetical protein